MTTDFESRLEVFNQIVSATQYYDNEFLNEVHNLGSQLPEGSELKFKLNEAMSSAHRHLVARQANSSFYGMIAAAGTTALAIYSNPSAGLMLLMSELVAATIFPEQTRKLFHHAIENIEAILNATESEQPQQVMAVNR